MKERQILMNGQMVLATLAGIKTQMRRPVDGGGMPIFPVTCPYGKPGDRLWVRETWQAQTPDGLWWHEVKREDRALYNWAVTNPVEPAYEATPPRWLPSIHMPRWACRLELEITGKWTEELCSISEQDAIAEGIECTDDVNHYWRNYETGGQTSDPCESYATLWDSIYAKRGYPWQSDPWVWVVEFNHV